MGKCALLVVGSLWMGAAVHGCRAGAVEEVARLDAGGGNYLLITSDYDWEGTKPFSYEAWSGTTQQATPGLFLSADPTRPPRLVLVQSVGSSLGTLTKPHSVSR